MGVGRAFLKATGVLVSGVGLFFVAAITHESRNWTLAGRARVDGFSARNEGKVVEVRGPLESQDAIGDPIYVSGRFVVLHRSALSLESSEDSDGDTQTDWVERDALDGIETKTFCAESFSVRGLTIATADVTVPYALVDRVTAEDVSPSGDTRAPRGDWDGSGFARSPVSRVEHQGLRVGRECVAIGRQRGAKLEPFDDGLGHASVWLACDGKGPQEDRAVSYAAVLVGAALLFLGLAMTILTPGSFGIFLVILLISMGFAILGILGWRFTLLALGALALSVLVALVAYTVESRLVVYGLASLLTGLAITSALREWDSAWDDLDF